MQSSTVIKKICRSNKTTKVNTPKNFHANYFQCENFPIHGMYYVRALFRSQFWQVSCQQSYCLWQKILPNYLGFQIQVLFWAIKTANKISERSIFFIFDSRHVRQFSLVTRKLSKFSRNIVLRLLVKGLSKVSLSQLK